MGYDRGDSFPFDFEPNGIWFKIESYNRIIQRIIQWLTAWDGGCIHVLIIHIFMFVPIKSKFGFDLRTERKSARRSIEKYFGINLCQNLYVRHNSQIYFDKHSSLMLSDYRV